MKQLMLGTAQWGWTIPSAEAFKILDAWLQAGHRAIDAATNYPLDGNPADFRAAEKILLEYCRAHGLSDLRVTMKIGSLSNQRSPDVNLSPSFVLMMAEEYLRLFGGNLDCVMFHWDNREDEAEIRASLEALLAVQKEFGLRPGLSGIDHPEVYDRANEDYAFSFDIQAKHNVFQSDLPRYASLLKGQGGGAPHRFFAYGLNAGGVKIEANYEPDSTFLARGGDPEKVAERLEKIRALLPEWNTAFVRPPVKTMNHLGLIHAAWEPRLQGIVLGVSSVSQLKETLDYWRNFEVFEYGDVAMGLKKL